MNFAGRLPITWPETLSQFPRFDEGDSTFMDYFTGLNSPASGGVSEPGPGPAVRAENVGAVSPLQGEPTCRRPATKFDPTPQRSE